MIFLTTAFSTRPVSLLEIGLNRQAPAGWLPPRCAPQAALVSYGPPKTRLCSRPRKPAWASRGEAARQAQAPRLHGWRGCDEIATSWPLAAGKRRPKSFRKAIPDAQRHDRAQNQGNDDLRHRRSRRRGEVRHFDGNRLLRPYARPDRPPRAAGPDGHRQGRPPHRRPPHRRGRRAGRGAGGRPRARRPLGHCALWRRPCAARRGADPGRDRRLRPALSGL